MNFATVKSIAIPEGKVSRILIGDKVIWKSSPLPTGYQVIEYIETTKAQYIDTGFVPDNNSRIVADFVSTGTSTTNDIMGCRTTSSKNGFALTTISGNWRMAYNASVSTGVAADNSRHTADLNRNVLSLDGEVIYTAEETTFTCSYSICLGATNTSSPYLGYARFYSCQIYDDDTLVRDLIPCVNDLGEAGMYDKLNKVFYGNAGEGTFIVG